MSSPKETIVKEVLSIRRRKSVIPTNETREIELFEAQIQKSLKRVDPTSYLAKKFDMAELEGIRESYKSL